MKNVKKVVLALAFGTSAMAVSVARADDVADGKALFDSKGCAACHAIAPGGVSPGPNLIGVGTRRDEAGIVKQIVTPAANPNLPVQMPAGLADMGEAAKIAKYLVTLK